MGTKIKVISDKPGRARVWLDDREITDKLSGVRFSISKSKNSRVVLDMVVDEIEFHADVEDLETRHPDGDFPPKLETK